MSPYDQQQLIESELREIELQISLSQSCPRGVEQVVSYLEDYLFASWLNASVALQDCGIQSGRIYTRFRRETGTTPPVAILLSASV